MAATMRKFESADASDASASEIPIPQSQSKTPATPVTTTAATELAEKLSKEKKQEQDQAEGLKLRQMDKFRELLRDKYADGRITLTNSWEQAVKHIQHDPRFRI